MLAFNLVVWLVVMFGLFGVFVYLLACLLFNFAVCLFVWLWRLWLVCDLFCCDCDGLLCLCLCVALIYDFGLLF